MNVMNNRLFKLLSVAVAGLLLTGCYNDFENPKPAKIYTRADMSQMGLEHISIRDLKQMFRDAKGSNDGLVASLTIDQPLFTDGKVISSDRDGNVYKSLYIYDEESKSAIELKLVQGNYLFHPVGQIVFVKLQNLVVGNYRGMLSVGTSSSDPDYSNDNITSDVMLKQHIFSGARMPMLPSDTLVVTRENYRTAISDADLGRLVRFEGLESKFGTAAWGYQNTFPNYFANKNSYDVNSPGWEDIPEWATWAAKRPLPSASGEGFVETFFYGSAWFTFGDLSGSRGEYTPGNYVVRSSGYSSFRDNRIPADGSVVDLTAIYTKYTDKGGGNVAYQLVLNTDKDVIIH